MTFGVHVWALEGSRLGRTEYRRDEGPLPPQVRGPVPPHFHPFCDDENLADHGGETADTSIVGGIGGVSYLKDPSRCADRLRQHGPRQSEAQNGKRHHEIAHVTVWKEGNRKKHTSAADIPMLVETNTFRAKSWRHPLIHPIQWRLLQAGIGWLVRRQRREKPRRRCFILERSLSIPPTAATSKTSGESGLTLD